MTEDESAANAAASRLRAAQVDSFNGHIERAREGFLAAKALFDQLGDVAAAVGVLSELGVLEGSVGLADAGRRRLEEAIRISKDRHDDGAHATHLRRLGDLEASVGNCDAANGRYESSRTICRELSDEIGEALSWLGSGNLAVAMSRYDEARDHFDRAHALHMPEAELRYSATLSRCLGDLERKVGRMQQAELAYEHARGNYAALSIEGRGYLHFGLGDLARMRSDSSAPSELRRAMELFLACEHRSGQGLVHCALGEMARQTGEVDAAAEEFQRAIAVLKSANARLGLGNAHRGLALVERNRGRYTEAKRAFREARICYRSVRLLVGEAHALRGIGEIDHLEDRENEARENLKEALEIYRSVGQLQGKANTLVTLGDVEVRAGDLAAAESAYRGALALYREVDEPLGVANASRSLAYVSHLSGRGRDARREYLDALSRYEQLDTPAGTADCHLGLAEVELAEDHLQEAERQCLRALAINGDLERELVRSQCLFLLGQIYIAMGRREQAVDSLDQAAAGFDLLGHHKERQEASQLAAGVRGSVNTLKPRAIASHEPLPVAALESKQLVILVHGIRTHADWVRFVKPALESAGFTVVCTNYERLGAMAFWMPIEYFRGVAMRKVERDIRDAKARYQQHKVSYIAHSFGSYVIARLLHERSDMRAERVIFCGSIVPARFKLDEVITRIECNSVLNEVGTHDVWPALAEAVTWGYGSVGTFGFRRPIADERWHANFRHSSYLNGEFCTKHWVPYLRDGTITPTSDDGTRSPKWFGWLHWVKRIYVLAGAGFVGLAYVVLR